MVEQLLVHAGRLRVGPEQDPVELGPGDFVAFDGSVAHVYEALSTRSPGPSRSASATAVAIVAWPQNGTSASGLK